MPVAFADINPNTLLPLFYAEVTSAPEAINANLKLCLIGQMNKNPTYGEGYGVVGMPYLLTGEDADELFGRGSMLSWMYQRARANAPFAEIWAVAMAEDPAAVRGTWTVQVTKGGSNTRNGLARFFIAGRPVDYRVNANDLAPAIAARLAMTINHRDLPVKATVGVAPDDDTVTLTCRWAGTSSNGINITYAGPLGRPSLTNLATKLAYATLSIERDVIGQGDANVGGSLDAVADRPFDVFCSSFHHDTFIQNAGQFMAGRWHPSQMAYGHMFIAEEEPVVQDLIDKYDAYNDPHISVLGYKHSVMPPWEWVASIAAIATAHWAAPPELSRPLQTLPLIGMFVGDDDDSSWNRLERELLLEAGVTTFGVGRDSICRIDRVRTLRKYNAYGDPDVSWADAVTMFQAQYFVRQMRAAITNAYPRAALTDVPTGINGFTSAPEIRQVILHTYKRLESVGLVENYGLFAQYLVCERDEFDKNRVNVLMRPDMVNQLRVVAAVVETHLELDSSDPTLLAAA